MTSTLLRVSRRASPADRVEQQFPTLPFELPAGTAGVSVDLHIESGGEGVVDLGLTGPDGVVGWSGSARRHVLVAESWATPGYHPTSMREGDWAVLLGLHRVPDDGVLVHVGVRSVDAAEVLAEAASQPPDPPVGERPPPRDLPAFGALRWRPGDLHAHSIHSDGALSVAELAELAASRGLEFLAVTDHNTTSHHRELHRAQQRYGITLVPGQEVTRDTGHANALGELDFVDFRESPETWARTVALQGGILSVNHPLGADCAWLHRVPVGPGPRVAEVWHSSWAMVPTWGAPLAWWDALGQPTTPVGGSDFHHHGADGLPGEPTTWVLAEDDDVLGAVAAGRTAVSATREGPVLLRHGDELYALAADGLILTGFDQGRRLLRGDQVCVQVDGGPWWLEDGTRRVHALSP